ncbi:MAG: MFS transporter [Archangiaceae bacterium]|nr:MFS transporter [Archangiaceae bacterium]
MVGEKPTPRAWAALTAAWVGWVLDAFDFSIFFLVMPKIAAEFGVPIKSTAASVTATLVVRLLGSFVAGWLADRFGRKWPLIISIVWFSVCDGLVAFAPTFRAVVVLRILYGFGMGAEWTAGATLAMEAWPEKSRGFASGVLQAGWAVGYLIASVVYAYVYPVWGWRALFMIAAAPALIALPIRFFVDDTHAPPKNDPGAGHKKVSRELLRSVALASFVLAFGFAVYFALTTFLPTLLEKEHHFDPGTIGRHVAAFNVGMLIGAPVCGWLATRVPPMRAIALCVVFAPLCTPLAVGWAGPGWMLPGAVLVGAFAGGPSGVTPVWLAQLFPAWFRARGTGLCYHLAAFAAAFTPFGVAAIAEAGAGFARTVVYAVAALAWSQVVVLWLLRGATRANASAMQRG